MAICNIIKNNKGKIIKVINPLTGKEDGILKKIAEIPLIEDLSQALDVYDEVLKISNKNANLDLKIKSDGIEYNSYKEALENSSANTIDIFSNNQKITSFSTTLDERSMEGLINSLIYNNIIESKKVILDGETFLQSKGETPQDKIISEEFLKEYLRTALPKDSYTIKEGLLKIHPVKVVESKENTEHKIISDKLLNYFSADTILTKNIRVNENNLKLNLMKILSDMGVSVLTLQQYQQKFKKKSNNIPPSAEALADIVNRVVAFKEGGLNLDNLTEEVMHFIVETLPQEELSEMSDLIKNSQEYKDHYERYRDVYNNDNILIEKEILGKILKNITINKVQNKDKSFISKLINLIEKFFDSLTLKQSQKDQLKKLNNLVEKLVIENNQQQFTEDSLSQSKEIALMYSLSDKVSDTQGALEKTLKNATDFKFLNTYKRQLQNKSFDNLRGSELVSAISLYLQSSNKLIETTESALKTSKKNNKALSGQNAAILTDLYSDIGPKLLSLAKELDIPQEGIERVERIKLAEKLRENNSKILELKQDNENTTDDHINKMTEEIVQQLGQAEGEFYKEQVRKVLKGEINDVNRLFSFFGQLHHSSNPILNMIGNKIWEMNMKSNKEIKEDISPFLNFLEENPDLKDKLPSLVKNGYFEDIIDHKAFKDTLEIKEMESFLEISGEKLESTSKVDKANYNVKEISKQLKISQKNTLEKLAVLEKYRKLKSSGELPALSNEQYGNYRNLLDKNQQPFLERVMNEEYYNELFKKYDKLNISGATKSFLKENSSQRGVIKANATQKYTKEDGTIINRVVFTPENNNLLNSISKVRKAKKSIYSEISLLKKGLKLSNEKPQEESVELPTGQYLSLNISEDMSQGEKDEANISFDLHKLDNFYIENLKKEGENTTTNRAKLNFISYLQSLNETHSTQELYEVVLSNLDISLSQEFYNNLNGESFLKGDILNKLNPDKKEIVEEVKKLYAKRNSILSIYRNTSSPFEIDRMSPSDQTEIQNLSMIISNSLKKLTLPESSQEDSIGQKSPNNSYFAELERQEIKEGTQEELDFIIKGQHSNIIQINKIKDLFYKNEVGLPLSETDVNYLNKYLKDSLLETQLNYAKNNLQSYYTRFAPVGYESMQERLNKGEELIEVLNSILNNEFLNIRIDSSFEEKDNPFKNPNYNDQYDGGFQQPKKGSFLNKNFIDRFGINEKGEATKETKLFELRKLYLEARKKGLEKMNEKGANPYKTIQISQTTTEKLRNLAKGNNKVATAKELLKDTFSYRVDDLAYGETGFQENKNLPKYYIKDLETPTDVSTDYAFALTQFISRANEYKAKRNVISDIDALYDVLLRSKRHSKSKDLKNTIDMARSYIDGNIYGKIENRTYELKVPGTDYSMDVAKVSRLFTKYVSLKNLGFNTTVPLTGFFSGLVSKKVEEWIGEKLNKDSAKLANAEYKKLFKEGRSKALDFNDNSKLFLIGQAFGIYDISEKARNAKYNKFQRTFSKSAMSLHTLSNYPIIPKIALTVLYDNRIIDGKIMNRQQYFQQNNREGIPIEETELKWKSAEENAIYNYMNFTKTGFNWSSEINDMISDKEYLENRKLFMMKFIRSQVSNIDATIPQEMKLAAQRDMIGSMMLLHKGFLSIFLQNRLKKKNLNIDTGLLEEGSYRTLGRLMGDFFNVNENGDREMKKKVQRLIGSIKPPKRSDFESQKDFSNAMLDYELEIRNMKRIGKEMASMGILVTLGSLIFAMASDPDNEDIYALQMSSYLMTRLLNESGTAFTPSIMTDLTSVIESPIVTYDTAKQFAQVYNLFDGDEIKTGKYKGLSVRERWVTKNVLGFKGIYDIYGADNIRESEKTYRKYNEENINRATLGLNSLFKSIYKD